MIILYLFVHNGLYLYGLPAGPQKCQIFTTNEVCQKRLCSIFRFTVPIIWVEELYRLNCNILRDVLPCTRIFFTLTVTQVFSTDRSALLC